MKNIEEKLLKSRPSVSIIILSLNEAGNIRQAIELVTESVIKQNLTDYEIIAVDGGSTDGTREIIKELVLKNNHIKAVLITVNEASVMTSKAAWFTLQKSM